MINRITLFFLSICLIISCKKENAVAIHPQMAGYWKHYTNATKDQSLQIDNDGTGCIYYHESGEFYLDSQTRKWLTKDNILTFGWLGQSGKKTIDEKFIIDSLPQTATFNFMNNYDTVLIGDRYMWLDGRVYVDKQ